MPSEERLENLVGWPSSPRISFSHDLSQSDISPAPAAIALRSDSSLPLDTDFDFSLSCEISAEDLPSSADELFSDGKLLPLPIKQRSSTSDPASLPPHQPPPPPLPPLGLEQRKKRESLKEIMMASAQELAEEDRNGDDRGVGKRSFSRTFWRFGRSSSLGGSRSNSGGLTCPFPLYRSRSDGSNQYSNPTPTSKIRQFKKTIDNVNSINNNNNSKSGSFRKASNDSTTKAYYYSGSKKGAYGNGLRISPVINVPAPYLFSRGNGGTSTNGSSVFGYLLCSCSNKSMKRRAVTCSP